VSHQPTEAQKAWPAYLALLAKGICMGVAELVPGVSGGTIAFLTGIYFRLVSALSRFGPASIPLIRKPKTFWHVHDMTFLLTLGVGMLIGILVFAQLVSYLLAHTAPVLWGFFFGLITASSWFMASQRQLKSLLSFGILGIGLGLSFLQLPQQDFSGSWLMLFFAGALAVSAWMLPGISGSLLLLLLGLYEPLIIAVKTLDVLFLSVLIAGCLSGLLLFARSLRWLMQHYQDPVLALLIGFMLAALAKLWPWQNAALNYGLMDRLLWPAEYAELMTVPAFLPQTLVAAVAGFLAVWTLTRLADR